MEIQKHIPRPVFTPTHKLVDPSHPTMNQPPDKFDFANPQMDPIELSELLVKHMQHFGGIGLSANQLGLPYEVFCMVGEPMHVCFNPIITGMGNEINMLDEGCLSWPGLYLKIKRPAAIRVRFYDYNGELVVKKFAGISARVFQHEYEHLLGEHFIDHVSQFALNRAREKQTKILRKVRKQLRDANKQVKKIR